MVKLNGRFFQQAFCLKVFTLQFCEWVARFIQGGSVGIRINDNMELYFQTLKELHQGEPLSTILFNIVAEMLAIVIAREKQDEQIGGLVPHHVDWGISILQYAEMTQFYSWNTIWKKVVNMEQIVCFCEQLYRLKINFLERDIFLC
jgi:hypothetical protein